jgi:hypothetical protein
VSNVVGFDEGKKPSPADAVARIAAAKGSLPEHDPVHDVLDAMAGAVQSIAAAAANAGTSHLTDEQMRTLTDAVNLSVHRSMSRHVAGLSGWRLAFLGAVAVVPAAVAALVTYELTSRTAAAEMAAARIEVPAVFGSLPASEAAAWAKLIRDNPPIGRVMASAQPLTNETRGKAVSLAVWVDPPKPATPGAH